MGQLKQDMAAQNHRTNARYIPRLTELVSHTNYVSVHPFNLARSLEPRTEHSCYISLARLVRYSI